MKDKFRSLLKSLWGVLSRNVALKLLSILFAIMVWSYVISTNPSITRTKTIDGITGYVTGQATLEVYDLALLTDPTQELSDVTVTVQVPQSSLSLATSDNIQVTLDISSVRTAGTQEVPLKATSSYGKVVSVYPASLNLTFEALDSRSVPVNVQMNGAEDGYWYNVSRMNPQQITISGATSLVQSLSSAMVTADMSGRTASFSTSSAIELMDSSGNPISTSMLNRSATSVSLGVDVYPTKELEVSTATDDVLLGQVAPGYIVESITCKPQTVTVAGEQSLLDSLDNLVIEPIEIDNPNQSFTKRANIATLADLKYISSEQVYITVQIAEETTGGWIEGAKIQFLGKDDGLLLSWQDKTVDIHVTGPRSKVETLVENGVTVTVDLTGLGEGTYDLPVTINESDYPGVVFEPDTTKINVTLQKDSE